MILSVPFILLLAHWIGDFVLQADWMALNKSKDNFALTAHCFIVALVTGVTAAQWLVGSSLGFWFIFITFVCHFCTDYVTSRINAKLWQAEQIHWFFVSIGFDQLLHYFQLAVTYHAMVYSPILHL